MEKFVIFILLLFVLLLGALIFRLRPKVRFEWLESDGTLTLVKAPKICAEPSSFPTKSTAKKDGGRPRAFARRTSLKSITLSDGLQTIDSWAFANCDLLTIVASPGTVGAQYAAKNEIPVQAP